MNISALSLTSVSPSSESLDAYLARETSTVNINALTSGSTKVASSSLDDMSVSNVTNRLSLANLESVYGTSGLSSLSDLGSLSLLNSSIDLNSLIQNVNNLFGTGITTTTGTTSTGTTSTSTNNSTSKLTNSEKINQALQKVSDYLNDSNNGLSDSKRKALLSAFNAYKSKIQIAAQGTLPTGSAGAFFSDTNQLMMDAGYLSRVTSATDLAGKLIHELNHAAIDSADTKAQEVDSYTVQENFMDAYGKGSYSESQESSKIKNFVNTSKLYKNLS